MADRLTLRVESRTGRTVLEQVVTSPGDTVKELMETIHRQKNDSRKYHPVRQRLTFVPEDGPPVVLQWNRTLESYGLKSGMKILHKDLGQQVGYRFVFFMEYLGPLLVYPFFWSSTGREVVHGMAAAQEETLMAQDLAVIYWSIHFFKRIYETYHVHRFSHATMPIFNLFRNCGYYWLFAAFVSYNVNHPKMTEPPLLVTVVAILLAYCCEVGNLLAHVTLSRLRKPGGTGYTIPKGGLFDYVTCANYTFEIWGWILFSIATQSLPAAVFCTCGAAQMVQWAVAKHSRLRKIFDGKDGRELYPRRWVILPPFI